MNVLRWMVAVVVTDDMMSSLYTQAVHVIVLQADGTLLKSAVDYHSQHSINQPEDTTSEDSTVNDSTVIDFCMCNPPFFEPGK